jgi:nucleoside-diphosphate-sugar epimerase
MLKEYVTGANGFLGKHLVKELGEVTPIPHDRIQTTKLEPFSRFFFLSAYGNMAGHDEGGPEGTAMVVRANVTDLAFTLEEAIKFPFKSFAFVSTSSVKLETQTTYSRTKKAAEEILLAYKEKYHVPICIIRPFSVTGVGEQPNHLIPTLIRSCLTGEKMNFVKEPCHDFIDVSDVVSGMINLSQNSAGGIFELGSGVSTSNQQVLEIVEKVTGKKANVNIVGSMRQYDTKNWVSQNYRARSFGWLPKKTLEQSITEMVEYERSRQK